MRLNALLLLSIACVLFSTKLMAQDTIFYSARFSNAIHHESEISITYENVNTPFLKLMLSNYSPGRYANHEFGKNVYGLKAFSAADAPLEINRIGDNEWLVKVVDGYVKVNYTLFADHADGTYSGIDREFIHLNIPSAFMWAMGTENKPLKLSLHFPDNNWNVATQLKEVKKDETYFAPDFQYFVDSPIIIGNMDSREVWSGSNNKILIYTNPDAVDEAEDKYADMTRKVVLEQREVFGGFPDFEYGEYKFLCSYGRGFHGDGMEHRNSTMITSGSSLPGNEEKLIGTVAHEFFHCWNVERLRPKSLQPFNLTAPSICGELWFAEGFTSYYGPLTLTRAGIYNDSLFTTQMANMINYVQLSPGTGKYSPVEMSEMAVFVDASSFNDPTNFHNNFTSYYPYGAVLALALDLELRHRFNLTLDNYMKLLWDKYGRTQTPYTNENLKNELALYSGSSSFSETFFDKYIYGTEVPDFKNLLKNAGYELKVENSNGTDLLSSYYAYEDSSIVFKSKPMETSTFYVAGVNQGDKILSINGTSFTSLEDFRNYLSQFTPGQKLHVAFSHFGKEHEAITLAKPDFSIVISDMLKDTTGKVSEVQQQFRNSWLSSRVNN